MKYIMENWRRLTEEEAKNPRQFSSFVVFINPEEKILILKRQNNTGMRFPGLWSFAGGGAEEGEDPEAAATREALEETGITINKIEHVHTKNDGRGTVHFFKCLDFDGEVQKDKVLDEHDDFRWINPNELDQYHTAPEVEQVVRKAFGTNVVL
jgi:8-oxo-dGTP diphosphatase|tara:strand:- start:187 stop:645 length:459 start_codon:yes stop_codon:yes gene_type:complete